MGEWSAARHGRTLPPGKTRYLLYRRLGGPQGRSSRAEILVPTGIRPWNVQPSSSVTIPSALPGPCCADSSVVKLQAKPADCQTGCRKQQKKGIIAQMWKALNESAWGWKRSRGPCRQTGGKILLCSGLLSLNPRTSKWRHLNPSKTPPWFPEEHCFWKFPRLRPFVLLARARRGWRWVWSVGGK